MRKVKKLWMSKLFWIGIFQFTYGSVDIVAKFIEKSDFSPTAIAALISGILIVVFRVWFTDHDLEV